MALRHNDVYLKHILDEANFILIQSRNITFEKFSKDEVLKRACARSLEIIGEAVKNLSLDFKAKYKSIEWKRIAGLRDKIIHYYFGVDWDMVWDIMEEKIPQLKIEIEKILNK